MSDWVWILLCVGTFLLGWNLSYFAQAYSRWRRDYREEWKP